MATHVATDQTGLAQYFAGIGKEPKKIAKKKKADDAADAAVSAQPPAAKRARRAKAAPTFTPRPKRALAAKRARRAQAVAAPQGEESSDELGTESEVVARDYAEMPLDGF